MPHRNGEHEIDETRFKNEDFDPPDGQESAPPQGNLVADNLPKATHTGELRIGNAIFKCAVLEDGTRVLTQQTLFRAMGRQGRPRERTSLDAEGIPPFLNASNLEPFFSDELRQSWRPILFRPKKGGLGGISYGYRAELLPQICNVYLDADDAGQLKANQKGIAQQCQVLIRGLATVGIVALVDEATGYQEARDRDALHRILEAYIAKELLPWSKRFPDEFYQQLFRLRGWQYSPLSVKRPQIVGHLTNEIVYDRLPPGVKDELRRINPIIKDGRRAHKHHQFLTEDIGNPHLEKHLASVIALMRASPTWGVFKRLLERAFPIPNQPQQQELIPYDELEYEIEDKKSLDELQ